MNEIKFDKNWFLNCYLSKHTIYPSSRQVYFEEYRSIFDNANLFNKHFKFTSLPDYDYIAELLESAIKENNGLDHIRKNSTWIIANELILKYMREQGWIEE